MNLTPPSTGNTELDAFLYQLAQYVGGVQQASVTPVPGGYSPSGNLVQYPLRYIHVKFADDNIGTGMADLPAGKLYFGLFNSSSSVESVTPADYTWILVSGGGMGTTKNFWYRTIGGAYLDYAIASASPGNLFTIDTGGAIDLNVNVTAQDTIGRVAYAKAITQQLASAPYNVATLGSVTFPASGTWGFAEVWQGTPPVVTDDEVLFSLDGVYNASTNTTLWGSPYLTAFKVGQLSAIQAEIGNVIAGSSPALSGTTMTGSGLYVTNTGQVAIGNAANNFVFDGTNAYINGFTATSAEDSALVNSYSGAAIGTHNNDSHTLGEFLTVTLNRPTFIVAVDLLLGLTSNAAALRFAEISGVVRVRRNIAGTWTLLSTLPSAPSGGLLVPLAYNTAGSTSARLPWTAPVTIAAGDYVAGASYRVSILFNITILNPDGGAVIANLTDVTYLHGLNLIQYRI